MKKHTIYLSELVADWFHLMNDYSQNYYNQQCNKYFELLDKTNSTHKIKISYTNRNIKIMPVTHDNFILFGYGNDISNTISILLHLEFHPVKPTTKHEAQINNQMIDYINGDYVYFTEVAPDYPDFDDEERVQYKLSIKDHLQLIELIRMYDKKHKIEIPRLFYTNLDIAHDLKISPHKVNQLLHPNNRHNNTKLLGMNTTIIANRLIDNTGDTHWIKDKNGKWIKQNTFKTPYEFGKYKPQTLISSKMYHTWKNINLDPKKIQLKEQIKYKYRYASKDQLIDSITLNQYHKNLYKDKYQNAESEIDHLKYRIKHGPISKKIHISSDDLPF